MNGVTREAEKATRPPGRVEQPDVESVVMGWQGLKMGDYLGKVEPLERVSEWLVNAALDLGLYISSSVFLSALAFVAVAEVVTAVVVIVTIRMFFGKW